jgi:hypothetical protein
VEPRKQIKYLKEYFAEETLARRPDPEEEYGGMNRGKKRSVEPATTL